MGIIDIPGERFNLAGKEATFSLSYLGVILEMTIATSQGGDAGHGAGALPESDAAGPQQTAVRRTSPPGCAWPLPAHTGHSATLATPWWQQMDSASPRPRLPAAVLHPNPILGSQSDGSWELYSQRCPQRVEGAFPALASLKLCFLSWESRNSDSAEPERVPKVHTGGS